ncbi:MAG TPA: AAA-like domain-containing protein, partial [Woeseiaceae bacterium]|nr:AAA-like domain-containing protein [Woeseiaceae bacterium]
MTENTGQYTLDTDTTGEFFTVATPLHAVRPGYVRRAADEALYDAIVAGRYAHIIAPNRSGKSSLVAATSARLQNHGLRVAVLDLAQISERDGGTDAGRWYYSVAYRLLRQLRLKIDLQDWWQEKSILSNRQRLVEFYSEVILQHIEERVVIFVDQIQCVQDKPYSQHVLASIRAAWNSRVTEPDFQRLSFVLVGECDPVSMMPDPEESPFAVSQEIRLSDFTRDDLDVFAAELNLSPSDAAIALDRVYYCTGGHPYLTQKLARAIARERISGNIKEHVDRIALQKLAGRAALHSEPHMSHIHRRIVNDRKNAEALLNLYGRLRKGIEVEYDPESRHQRMLMSIGLVVRDEHGRLKVRNRLYRAVFTARWANENLPLHWRGPVIALLILLAVTSAPFWYTQMLPRPYIEVLSSPTLALDNVYDAYVNLRSFPGHAESAERLFRNQLELRASQASSTAVMGEIDSFARRLPDSDAFADAMLADFWDRRVARALQSEQRDDALLAALECLVVPTPTRRRRAALLIGEDYRYLIGTIPPRAARAVMFDPENLLLTFGNGAEVRQWSMINGALRERPPWRLSALDVTPLVRRTQVEGKGRVQNIELTVIVAHPRLEDIRLKLIAPSGRTVELQFPRRELTESQSVTFPDAALREMKGESLTGTWSVSLRDEATGMSGRLHGWELRLNGRAVGEDLERGLTIPDPEARASDDVWFTPEGRYAIARATRSDSARLWDLASAQPLRTIAVPAGERVLGLSENADVLMTVAQNTVNLWRAEQGTRHGGLELADASAGFLRSTDGRHVLVWRHHDSGTRFELWSLEDEKIVARLAVAGALSQVTIDADGDRLAVADYDRAVRVWNLRNGRMLSQIDLRVQPSEITLSANGDTLGVVHGSAGISIWRTDRPEEPLVMDRGTGRWQLAFSPSGNKVIAGNERYGFQIYRSADGALSGPSLGSDHQREGGRLLAFSGDEEIVVTAEATGKSRVWRVPATSVASSSRPAGDRDSRQVLWRELGDLISTLGPGGERLAIGDNAGHVHILHVNATEEELAQAADELSFLGHRGPVADLVFSPDGALIASADATGTVRIWDVESGLPKPFDAGVSASSVDQMQFSPSSDRLAVLSGRRVWIVDASDGKVLTDVELGEPHTGIAFAADDQLFLGAASGALRVLETDRTGTWNIRNVWAGSSGLRRLEISSDKNLLVIVDAMNRAQLLDLRNGRIGSSALQLPSPASDIAFSPNESRVLFRTGRWIHRASASPRGLMWLDA